MPITSFRPQSSDYTSLNTNSYHAGYDSRSIESSFSAGSFMLQSFVGLNAIIIVDENFDKTAKLTLPSGQVPGDISFFDGRILTAGGSGDNNYYSDDLGDTWSLSVAATAGLGSPSIATNQNTSVIVYKSNSTYYYSLDNGVTYTQGTLPLGGSGIRPAGDYPIKYIPELGAFYCSNSRGLFISPDGVNWTTYDLNAGGFLGSPTCIDFLNGQLIFGTAQGRLYRVNPDLSGAGIAIPQVHMSSSQPTAEVSDSTHFGGGLYMSTKRPAITRVNPDFTSQAIGLGDMNDTSARFPIVTFGQGIVGTIQNTEHRSLVRAV